MAFLKRNVKPVQPDFLKSPAQPVEHVQFKGVFQKLEILKNKKFQHLRKKLPRHIFSNDRTFLRHNSVEA